MGVELSWTLDRVGQHLKFFYDYAPTAYFLGTTALTPTTSVLADLGVKNGDTITDVSVTPPPAPVPTPATLCWKTKTDAVKIRATPCGAETSPLQSIPPLTFVRGTGPSVTPTDPCTLATGEWHKVAYLGTDGYISSTLVDPAVCEGSDTPAVPTPTSVTPSTTGGTKCKKTKGTLARIRASPCGTEIQTVVPLAGTVLVVAGPDKTKDPCANGGTVWNHVFYAGRPGWIAASLVDEVDCECYKTGTGVTLVRDDACGTPVGQAVPAGTFLVKIGDEKTVATCTPSPASLTWANVAYSDKLGYVSTDVATKGSCN